MSESQKHSQPKALSLRKLEQQETLQSLNHWKTVFKNYFRRCQFYSYFLQPNLTWNNGLNRGFSTNETTGLKRTPQLLASDLEGFLECLASYLPFDYVSEKLLQESTDMDSVWLIIYEIYDVEVNTTHYLDHATMSRNPQETYRNYFNRLVGFVRQHLPKDRVEAEGIRSPNTGEQLTIGLLDSITVHWLLSIDKRLINIIKTEFATELKNKRLCQMVKCIATNIDELLQRYCQVDNISSISTPTPSAFDQDTSLHAKSGSKQVDMIIRRLEKLEKGSYQSKTPRPSKFSRKSNKNRNFCSNCSFLNKQLDANIDVKHDPNMCGRKKISVALIDSFTHDQDQTSTSSEDSDIERGEQLIFKPETTKSFLQTIDGESDPGFSKKIYPNSYTNVKTLPNYPSVLNNVISDNYPRNLFVNNKTCSAVTTCRQFTGTHHIEQHLDEYDFLANLNSLAASRYSWQDIQKSASPKIRCFLSHLDILVLLDSGAELNVVDADTALKAGLGIVETKEVAKAANQLPLDIVGRTSSPVTLKCITEEGVKMLQLGLLLVVKNLGVACLIGEPGKEFNNIICLPKRKLVLLAGGTDIHHAPYYEDKVKYHLARAPKTTLLQPGEQICYSLPPDFEFTSHVAITPRVQSLSWLKPVVQDTVDKNVYLTNSSSVPIEIKKSAHIADIRDAVSFQLDSTPPFPVPVHSDSFQFEDRALKRECSEDYLKQLQVDPDNVLSEKDKNLFHQLHLKYAHLFTPQPGRYNGRFGYVDNKLQFSTPPAPNSRTHIPNYSPSMNLLLAKKMDLLEEWGVLASPEQVGISVQFVSPSMLVPKPDSQDYRLVTDFAALNVYLKRLPNTSATIAQAKSRISKAKYVVHLDLANYFYQCGLQKNDLKYLGTVHPFKGLKIYTCDPQGLKGASERSYEKLLRIYGDLIQEGKLAQMADGLHALGDSIPELLSNYEEVLRRADLSNLTFKPSKVIVCPRNINLFGWSLKDQEWFPTPHTMSALVNAVPPKTVKQLRSFLGSFKQLSASLPNYASTIHDLERVAAGKKSAEKIIWTDSLSSCFEAAKRLAASPVGIAEPRPDDFLQTYSDYSAETKAVGGRLIIIRKLPNGETQQLVGGFFSVVLKHKTNWLPCEGEAAGIRLVLEHFRPYIRESQNTTVHFTDSLPCVLAWKRSLRGAFSASSRISAFLTGLSTLSIELRHKAGQLMHTSDYASRHPALCTSNRCQVCKFVQEWETIGDKAADIKSVTVEEIKLGKSVMPMTQRNTWKNIQKRDQIHVKLSDLIATQQLPETKKTRGNFTKIKLLHNLYTQGKLFVDNDGLVMVRTPEGYFNGSVISIPPDLFPGVANALHLQLDHPSRTQLASLMARYFYSPGWKNIIDEITNNCHQCEAVKKLPKVLLQDTTEIPEGVASNFAADVIERSGQKILVVRENLSQFTRAAIINDQTAETLRGALLSLILDLLPDAGAVIRVDGATSFQALEREALQEGTLLNKLKVKLVIGRLLNKNKNPIAENANQEILKEILRTTNKAGPINSTELMLVMRNVNSRIRYNGYTPKEILFQRDSLKNTPIEIAEGNLKKNQLDNRKVSSERSRANKAKTHSPTAAQKFDIGDLVFLRAGHSKNSPRDLYMVEGKEDNYYLIRKLGNRLRLRLYKALQDELILAPCSKVTPDDDNETPPSATNLPDGNPQDQGQLLTPAGRPLRKAAMKAHGIQSLSTLDVDIEKKKNQLIGIPPLKFGWLEEDQSYDSDYILEYVPVSPDCETPLNSTLSHSSSSLASTSSLDILSDQEEELIWDSSPEHDQLSFLNPPNPSDLPPTNSPPDADCQLANQPLRRFAISDTVLSRSNAFRHPPDVKPPGAPRKPQLHNPSKSKSAESSGQVSTRSRIPRPLSPSQVSLGLVNDISALPPYLPEQVTAQKSPPLAPVPLAPPEHAIPSRRRQSSRRPFSYKHFNNTGRKEPLNKEEEEARKKR